MLRLAVRLGEQAEQLLDAAAAKAGLAPDLYAEQLLVTALALGLSRQGKTLLLRGPELEALEQRLGGLPILNAQDLVAKVDRLAGISFEHLTLPFSLNQLELIAEKAERQGKTVEQLLAEMAPRVFEQFFDLLGAGR